MTFDGLTDFPHRRVQLHSALDTERSGCIVRQDTNEDTPSSVLGRSVIDDLCAFQVLVTIEHLGRGLGSAHGVPVRDTAFHDETDLGVVDPFPKCDIFVGNVGRQFLLGRQIECLELSAGCEGDVNGCTDVVCCPTDPSAR